MHIFCLVSKKKYLKQQHHHNKREDSTQMSPESIELLAQLGVAVFLGISFALGRSVITNSGDLPLIGNKLNGLPKPIFYPLAYLPALLCIWSIVAWAGKAPSLMGLSAGYTSYDDMPLKYKHPFIHGIETFGNLLVLIVSEVYKDLPTIGFGAAQFFIYFFSGLLIFAKKDS